MQGIGSKVPGSGLRWVDGFRFSVSGASEIRVEGSEFGVECLQAFILNPKTLTLNPSP